MRAVTVKERFKIYLRDFENWQSFDDEDPCGYYYEKFPEFTIIENDKNKYHIERYAAWMPRGINAQAYISKYSFRYHSTLIMTEDFFSSGDGNYRFAVPEIDFASTNELHPKEADNIYYFYKDSTKYHLSCLLHHKNLRNYYDFRKIQTIEIRE